VLAGVDDVPVLDLDPGLEPVGIADAAGPDELVQVAEHLGWWRIVVGDAELKRQTKESLHGSLRDPRHRGDRGLKSHAGLLELAL
jgi:hypothetical protein